MTIQTFSLGVEYPLLGFYGTAKKNVITSLGVVVAEPTCIPDPSLVPDDDSSSNALSTGAIVGIIFGVLFCCTGTIGLSYFGV